MFKVLASLFAVVCCASAITIHTPFNRAANIFAPYSQVDQNDMQNTYNGGFMGFPGGPGSPGFPGHYEYPIIPGVPASAYDNVRINIPVNHQMNLFSPHAGISSNNMQNSMSSFTGY